MGKHQTENPAGKAIHHFKVVGLLVASGASFIAAGYWLTSEVAEGMGNLTIALVGGFVVFVGVGIGPIIYADSRDWLRVRGELN